MVNNSPALLHRQAAGIESKKRIFIASYFIFLFANIFLPLFVKIGNDSTTGISFTRVPTAAAFFGISYLITRSMKPGRIYHSRGITIFIAGTFLYILYGYVISFFGFSLYRTVQAYRRLLAFTVFSGTLFLAARVVIAYNLELRLAKSIVIALGVTLVTAYIVNFDNFAFLFHIRRPA